MSPLKLESLKHKLQTIISKSRINSGTIQNAQMQSEMCDPIFESAKIIITTLKQFKRIFVQKQDTKIWLKQNKKSRLKSITTRINRKYKRPEDILENSCKY